MGHPSTVATSKWIFDDRLQSRTASSAQSVGTTDANITGKKGRGKREWEDLPLFLGVGTLVVGRSRRAVVVLIVVGCVGGATAVSEVEVNIVIVILVLLATVHVGIAGSIPCSCLIVVTVVLLLGSGRLGSRRGFSRLLFGCWRWCRLRRCLVVVAMPWSVIEALYTIPWIDRDAHRSSKRSSSKFSGSVMMGCLSGGLGLVDKICCVGDS